VAKTLNLCHQLVPRWPGSLSFHFLLLDSASTWLSFRPETSYPPKVPSFLLVRPHSNILIYFYIMLCWLRCQAADPLQDVFASCLHFLPLSQWFCCQRQIAGNWQQISRTHTHLYGHTRCPFTNSWVQCLLRFHMACSLAYQWVLLQILTGMCNRVRRDSFELCQTLWKFFVSLSMAIMPTILNMNWA